MTAQADRCAAQWLVKAQSALHCDREGRPWPAWSLGDTLAVAVLLHAGERLIDLDYTEVEALDRLRHDIDMPNTITAQRWFDQVRSHL